MLIAFITRLANILIRLLPCTRNNAVPALYSPINGYETAVMIKYVSHIRMTSASIAPNTRRRIGRCNTRTTTISVNVAVIETVYNCAALRTALSLSLRPRYWLVIIAPPPVSAANNCVTSTLILSTRLTLETAASPTPETIKVSAMPIVMLRNCSISMGQISANSALVVNKGVDCVSFACFSIFRRYPRCVSESVKAIWQRRAIRIRDFEHGYLLPELYSIAIITNYL